MFLPYPPLPAAGRCVLSICEMSDFSIISNNVRGLRNKKKRIKIFNYLKDRLKKGLILLQETHSTSDDLEKWSNELECKLLLNSHTSMSRGTLIAISKNLDYEIIDSFCDEQGRLQILQIKIDDDKYVICNIYNDNVEKGQIEVLKMLYSKLSEIESILIDKIIIAGDWNFILDKELDASGGNPSLKNKSISELLKIKETFELIDIFRVRNPELKRFTFRKNKPICQARLYLHRNPRVISIFYNLVWFT